MKPVKMICIPAFFTRIVNASHHCCLLLFYMFELKIYETKTMSPANVKKENKES